MNNPDRIAARSRGRGPTLLLGTALLLALAACRQADNDATPAPDPAPEASAAAGGTSPAAAEAAAPGGTVVQSQWQCGDERVSVRFDRAAENVTVVHGAGELVLPQVSAASGTRYADSNGNEFWTKGSGGTLTLSGTEGRECAEVAGPPPAPAS